MSNKLLKLNSNIIDLYKERKQAEHRRYVTAVTLRNNYTIFNYTDHNELVILLNPDGNMKKAELKPLIENLTKPISVNQKDIQGIKSYFSPLSDDEYKEYCTEQKRFKDIAPVIDGTILERIAFKIYREENFGIYDDGVNYGL